MMEDNLIGKSLDEYRLDTLLGQGGMARVYRAFDVRLERYAAIKVIDAPLRADSEYVKRFEREARAIAKLEHPHIVRLYRYGEVDGLLYMAMQYVNGVDLYYLLGSYRQDGLFIEPEDAGRIIRETCMALDYAHQHGVIHRDVKPSNIMLNKEGQILLTDFGLALLTDLGTRGEIFGTPHYIAPEQAISSAGAVPQSDLYSVGVILFEMFTGELPFDAAEPLDISMKHISETPPLPSALRPEISPLLEAVILKALSKQPGDRYTSGIEMANALDEALLATQRRTPVSLPAWPDATIPQRVQAGIDPLPPMPAPLASPPLPTVPSGRASPVAAGYPVSRRWMTCGLVAAALMAVGILALLVLIPRLGSPASGAREMPEDETTPAWITLAPGRATERIGAQSGDNGPTSAPPPSTEMLAATAAQIPMPAATTSPTSSPVPPTATAEAYILLFVKRGEDSLLVQNLSSSPFPLDQLHIGDGRGVIDGSEWGVGSLQPGACVVALKEGRKSRVPDIQCEEVGPRLKRSGPERFWKSTFSIYYADTQIGKCPEDQQQCQITLSISSP
jgi:serine/threonine protein kinase